MTQKKLKKKKLICCRKRDRLESEFRWITWVITFYLVSMRKCTGRLGSGAATVFYMDGRRFRIFWYRTQWCCRWRRLYLYVAKNYRTKRT